MVFQNYALWPNMRVFANVAYGLRLRKLGRSEIESRVMEGLRKVNLSGLEGRYPGQLSGGQQQRVALARGRPRPPPPPPPPPPPRAPPPPTAGRGAGGGGRGEEREGGGGGGGKERG